MGNLPDFLDEPINDLSEEDLGKRIDLLEDSLSRLDSLLRQLRSSGKEEEFAQGRAEALLGNERLSEMKRLYRTLRGEPEPPPIIIDAGSGRRPR